MPQRSAVSRLQALRRLRIAARVPLTPAHSADKAEASDDIPILIPGATSALHGRVRGEVAAKLGKLRLAIRTDESAHFVHEAFQV
jgi:hypothetical protein